MLKFTKYDLLSNDFPVFPLWFNLYVTNNGLDESNSKKVLIKAMRKEFFSGFSVFAKDETFFLPNSNLIRNKFDIFVFAVISRNKYGTKSGTRMCLIIV